MGKIKITFLSIVMAFAMCTLPLTLGACGEQFIIEQDYQLIGMQVIADNTEIPGFGNWEAGSFHETFIGWEGDDGTGSSMLVKDCKISVNRQSSQLIWTKGEFVATFVFNVISGSDEYPVYSYNSASATYKGKSILELSDSEQAEIPNIIEYYNVFETIVSSYETNLQLIAQKRSLGVYFSLIDRENTKCVYMCEVYGINI